MRHLRAPRRGAFAFAASGGLARAATAAFLCCAAVLVAVSPAAALPAAALPSVSGLDGAHDSDPAGSPPGDGLPLGPGARCAAAPCGYIRPTLELHFPEASPCFEATDECLPLPQDGQALRLQGTVRWSWDVVRDGTYPADSAQPIVISFSPGQKNPSWLRMDVEPATYTITAAQLNDPRAMQAGPDPAAPQLLYVYERPVNVTLTREGGEPGPGVVETLLKAQSSPSGAYFTASFAVKVIGFAQQPAQAPRDASGVGLALVGTCVAAVAAGAVVRRRM